MKVMIVDDNPDITETIKVIMEDTGYKTCTANSGKELLDSVTNAKPNIVLLDVMMPGLNTREILEGLNKKGLKSLKVILVTVVRFSEEELKSLMKEFNIVDYITKPFDVPDLVKAVKKHIK